MKKILMFATYTIANPQHGGQKRVRAIYDAYKKNENTEPFFTAIYFPLHYKESWQDDIAISKQYTRKLAENPLTGDVILGEIAKSDDRLKNKIINRIKSVNPDIIEFEHPFLYIGFKEILKDINFTGRIIYSSHNIEYLMKQEMLENENFDSEKTKEIVSKIEKVEESIIKDSDLIFAVSESDVKKINSFKPKCDVVLAQNGISKEVAKKEDIDYWDKLFKKQGVDRIAVFIGSAHPPNWTGYQKMVGAKVGFLRSNERIVMAGSIGEYFSNLYNDNTAESTIFWKRVYSTGRLSEDRLTGLINRADSIILPIVEGGGSNLKTAEALLSGKPVIGTTHAFRAFEKFTSFPNVEVAKNPEEFRKKISAVLRKDPIQLSTEQRNSLQGVTWDNVLSSALRKVEEL